MIWFDLLVSKCVSCEVLGEAIRQSTGFDDVRTVESEEQLVPTTSPSISCAISRLDQGFPLIVSLYYYGTEEGSLPNQHRVCRAIAKLGQCQILFSDNETSDPYQMQMIEASEEHRVVSLEPTLFSDGYYLPEEE